MRAWKSRILIVAAIILLPLEIALLVGLWPYLPIVGRAIAGTIVVACVCASVTMIAWTWRRLRAPHLIVERDVVVMLMRDGSYHHLSAEQEAAKLLPAPRETVSEEPAPAEGQPDHWRILELAGKGMDLRSIALACNTTYYQVQKITSAWDKKLKNSG